MSSVDQKSRMCFLTTNPIGTIRTMKVNMVPMFVSTQVDNYFFLAYVGSAIRLAAYPKNNRGNFPIKKEDKIL